MPAEVLRRAVVHDIRTVLQWPLEVRAHHGVVDDNHRVLALLLDQRANARDVHNLEERVSRGLEEDHRSLPGVEDRDHGIGDSGVNMVDCYAHVRAKVRKQTVRPTVEIVAGDNFATRLEEPGDYVQGGHAARNGESMGGGRYLGYVMLCGEEISFAIMTAMRLRRVPSRESLFLI